MAISFDEALARVKAVSKAAQELHSQPNYAPFYTVAVDGAQAVATLEKLMERMAAAPRCPRRFSGSRPHVYLHYASHDVFHDINEANIVETAAQLFGCAQNVAHYSAVAVSYSLMDLLASHALCLAAQMDCVAPQMMALAHDIRQQVDRWDSISYDE